MNSTSYSSVLSGYHVLPDERRRVARRRSRFPGMALFIGLLLIVAGLAMYAFAHHVRG